MALTVGSDIDSHCTKCKMELAHVVVALVGEKAKRVQCKTCGSLHNHKTAKEKKAASASRARKKASAAAVQDFDSLMAGRDISDARRYKTSETFEEDAVVDHKTFGFGLVTRLLSDGKIEVVFQDGTKTLVHGRQAG